MECQQDTTLSQKFFRKWIREYLCLIRSSHRLFAQNPRFRLEVDRVPKICRGVARQRLDQIRIICQPFKTKKLTAEVQPLPMASTLTTISNNSGQISRYKLKTGEILCETLLKDSWSLVLSISSAPNKNFQNPLFLTLKERVLGLIQPFKLEDIANYMTEKMISNPKNFMRKDHELIGKL